MANAYMDIETVNEIRDIWNRLANDKINIYSLPESVTHLYNFFKWGMCDTDESNFICGIYLYSNTNDASAALEHFKKIRRKDKFVLHCIVLCQLYAKKCNSESKHDQNSIAFPFFSDKDDVRKYFYGEYLPKCRNILCKNKATHTCRTGICNSYFCEQCSFHKHFKCRAEGCEKNAITWSLTQEVECCEFHYISWYRSCNYCGVPFFKNEKDKTGCTMCDLSLFVKSK